jgi:T1SS-143 domain-containing protein
VGQPATAGAYGSFTLDASGNWTYVLDNANAAVQALGQGDTLTETFTVASVDGTTSSVTVTINGTNDAAVISSGTGSVTEDDTLTTGGTLSITDVDSGEASFTAQNTNGAYGSFTINAAGAWTYSLDNAMVQALGAGQTLTETFTVASIDGTSSSVTVTINGTNDAAVISSGSGSVTEDGTLTTDGTLAITDVDSGEASFTAQSTNGAYGSFTLDASGNWTYSLDNANAAVQALGQGDTLTETFTVASVDGTTSSVTVTINGTNDAAVISSGTGSVTEDSVLTTGGTLIITDVDSGEASFVGQPSTAGTYGSFTLGTNGAWTYALNNANPTVQALGAGDTLSEAFTVASVDGTTSTVTVTINGTNDAPLAIADVASVSEDSIVTRTAATGVLSNDTDVDAGDTKAVSAVAFGATSGTVGSALNGNFGTLTLNADGSYSYVANSPAAQALARGQVTTDAFTYTVRDTTGATSSTTLTFTITGTNDAPVAVADVATAVEAGGVNNATAGTNPSGNVLANDTDVDAGDTKSVSAVAFGATSGALGSGLNGSYGTLTLNADGTYSYVVNNGNATVQALNAGQSLTEVFTYTMRDAAGTTSSSTLTVTIQGTNDAPVVGTATATVSEEGLPKSNPDTTGSTDTTNSPTASGTLSITDVDSSAFTVTLTAPTGLTSGGQAITWAGSGTNTLVGSAGGQTILTATIANNGAYTVTLSGPIDHAVAGAEDVQSFGIGVSVSDGLSTTTSTLTVNVEDDSPMIGTPMRALMLKDAGASAIGRLELSIGADQAGALAQFSATNGISVDANGHILTTLMSQTGTASGTSYLTYNGGKLHYVSASDGSLTAVSSNGTAVFSISGDPLSGQYRVTNHVSLDGALLTLQDFKISGGMSGVFQLGDGSSFELLATATNNGVEASVNTSANSFGVGKMQAIDHGEILSFQFRDVTTAAPTTMASAAFTTDKLNDGESLTWSAYAANGALLGSGTVAGNSSGAVSFAVTSAQLGGAEFSSISFGAANGSSYKLVIDSIIGHTQLYDQAIRLDVNGVDGDGDTSSTQSLNIIFDSGTTLLTAGTTPAAIGGGSGNDTLTGSSGDDMISGGAGNDTLFGGLGADTFIWSLADKGTSTTPAIDTIKDFDTVANSDKLDLRDLLVGESHAGTDAGNLADYLHFTFNAGTNTTTLAVKSNGASTSAPDQLIQLEGVDLVGSFTSDQQIIQNLFSQGKLITD